MCLTEVKMAAGPAALVRRPSGFTLIEVMGALLILSVAMMSVLRLGSSSTARLRLVDRRATAVRLAVERADSLAAVPYPSMAGGVVETTVTRGVDSWLIRQTVTQWASRVRQVKIRVHLVADTTVGSTVTVYRPDAW